jgi:hypothetical protein
MHNFGCVVCQQIVPLSLCLIAPPLLCGMLLRTWLALIQEFTCGVWQGCYLAGGWHGQPANEPAVNCSGGTSMQFSTSLYHLFLVLLGCSQLLAKWPMNCVAASVCACLRHASCCFGASLHILSFKLHRVSAFCCGNSGALVSGKLRGTPTKLFCMFSVTGTTAGLVAWHLAGDGVPVSLTA